MVPDTDWSFPPIPPEHKSLTPYFQRAQELRTKDPVVAYWCTFYAVQQGITTKPQNSQFLMHILNALEHMKATLADNEAVVNNSMGAAYIENFALRVFNMADNEDRNSLATRSTAKKFLASANFLEVLCVFEKPLDTDIIEKIRYAKWKAADLAKAFREGRKPTPGDINAPPPPSETAALPSQTSVANSLDPPPSMSAWSPGTSLAPSPAGPSNQTLELSPGVTNVNIPLPSTVVSGSPQSATRASLSSPVHGSVSLIPATDPPSTPSPRALGKHLDLNRDNEYTTPGMWSTVATPGVDDVHWMNRHVDEPGESPSARAATTGVTKGGMPSLAGQGGESDGDVQDDAWSTAGNMSMSRQNSWSVVDHASEALNLPDGTIPTDHTVNGLGLHQNDEAPLPPVPSSFTPLLVKKVHFSPSVVGGLSSASSSVAGSSPPGSPERYAPSLPTVQEAAWTSEEQGHVSMHSSTSVLTPEMHPLPDSGSEGSSLKDIPPAVHKIMSSAEPSLPSGLEAQPGVPELPTTLPCVTGGFPAQLSSSIPSYSPPPPVFPVVPSIPAGYSTSSPPPSTTSLHPVPRYAAAPLDASRKDHRHILRQRTPTPPPPDLSSVQISLIQKHCRFAISALDYEDAETARKELRAALAMLEG